MALTIDTDRYYIAIPNGIVRHFSME